MFRLLCQLTGLLLVCSVTAAAQVPSTGFSVRLPSALTIEPGSAADVSALMDRPDCAGRPAGTHGLLKTAPDRFEFEDGQSVRFWGLNWPAAQPMPLADRAMETARRLVRQGFNLVRLPLPSAGDASATVAFEQFSGCLRANGIYLDLLVFGDTNQIARVNAFTHIAPREDFGIAFGEIVGPPSVADTLRRSGWRQPLGAGPMRNVPEVTAAQTLDFLSQAAKWDHSAPMVKDSRTLFGAMGFGAAAGRPHVVGAWSDAVANPYRTELPLWTAATADFQKWAGVYVASDAPSAGSNAATPDIVTWTWAPASALLFLRGDVTPAKSRMLFRIASRAEWRAGDEPFAAAAGLGMARFTCEIAPSNTIGWLVLGGTEMAGVAALNPRTSDTGEIVHDRQAGQVKIDTPCTQAVIGFWGKDFIETRDLRLLLTNGTFAAVALTSLDDQPIVKSQRLLLTATGRADPSGAPGLEPVAGEVSLRWLAPSQHDRKVFALDLTGHRQKEVVMSGSSFRFQPGLNVAWYEIIAEAPSPKPAAPPLSSSAGAVDEKKKTE